MGFVLVIADALIPSHSQALPSRLQDLLKPGRISTVLCLGNCPREIIYLLKRVTNDVRRVRGDYDTDDSLPETRVLELEGLKVGMCHGHQIVPQGNEQALLALQRKLGVDVLFTASTHQLSVKEVNGVLLMNPGSATGASSIHHENPLPTFIVMDVTASKVLIWTYSALGDKLEIQRPVFNRPGADEATLAPKAVTEASGTAAKAAVVPAQSTATAQGTEVQSDAVPALPDASAPRASDGVQDAFEDGEVEAEGYPDSGESQQESADPQR